jgi:hypothetical protein
MSSAFSDERTALSFTVAADPRQNSLSRVQEPWDSRPYFIVSDSRLLQPGRSDHRIYIPQEQDDPVITSDTGFPLRRLVRLAGLRWNYSNPLPHALMGASRMALVIQPQDGQCRRHRTQQSHLLLCEYPLSLGRAYESLLEWLSLSSLRTDSVEDTAPNSLIYCCASIRYRWDVLIEPLPGNDCHHVTIFSS